MDHILCLLLLLSTTGQSAKILVMVTTPSPSLMNLFTPIIEELSFRKHDVTVQSLYPLKKSLSDVKELPLQPSDLLGDEEESKDHFLNAGKLGAIRELNAYLEHYTETCEDYLKDESTKKLLASGKIYDVVVADGIAECGLVVAAIVGNQTVGLIGCGNFPWMYSDVPAPPSYVPNYFRGLVSTMNFCERMKNAVDVAGIRLINDYKMQPSAQKIVSKYIPGAPTIQEVNENVAITLTNGDPVTYSPRPMMANVVDCGGLHCREAKPLPKELEDFVESSGEDGFIIFSLGTNMKSTFLPPKLRDAFLSAFSRLKQKVLWKFEAQLENLPKNVKITKFMPQQDLLGHPKIRLFITHAGLLSLQEAVYHGVPVIGMPFFIDQPGNIARIEELGMGERVTFSEITADGMYELINKLLTDDRYRNNAKKYSAIFKDQPTKPIDRAIYWIEYVLRHDGARHFRSAARDLNFFQYFLLDVIALMLIAVAVVLVAAVFLVRVIRKLSAKRKSAIEIEKKQL